MLFGNGTILLPSKVTRNLSTVSNSQSLNGLEKCGFQPSSSPEASHNVATHSSLNATNANNEGKERLNVSSAHHLSSQNLTLLPYPTEKTRLLFIKGKFSVKSYYTSLKVENNPLFLAKRCNLCKENEESADHILIHCGKTRELWTVVLSSFGVVWVFPNSVRNLLLEWKIKGLEKKRGVVWKMAPICLFWCIWGERNRRVFQEEEKSDTSLKNLFLWSLLEWSQQFMDVDYLSFMNVLGV
ncbi:hypothetical protein CK203_032497 [Vitis vinifera]|uniref:Reverse transcriptase zinc-binding domain-containing protein n=1 Tax=Vitis vinifera TaxID=29760 RepID=A0A438I6P3_VITVI|nr:hypothetical protein CK203_032497 [Vitis vinifera]